MEQKVVDRTKSLEMVRAKEEAILMSIGDGLIATNEKGVIILINKTAEKLLEKNRVEMIGKIFSEVVLMQDAKGVYIPADKHPISIALAESKTVNISAGYIYYERKNKTKLPLAIVATPVILNNKVIGAIKVLRDVTYEREVDKAKTEFVSLASHQLRTPLSAVNWYTEMLLAGDGGELNKKQTKYLEEVYRSNQRMVELVNALLDVSCLELGTFVIEPESTNIVKLAQSVISEQKPQITQGKIEFSSSFKSNIPPIKADPKLVRMILQNLLSNSIKYSPANGEVSLKIKMESKNSILIEISDNGYGIPENQQNKIFTKLFRADNVRDKDTDGTGLGLYIVKSVVENSGGKIWFNSSSNELNHGTSFFVSLPVGGVLSKAVN
jgi:signal transduction histidine kinase